MEEWRGEGDDDRPDYLRRTLLTIPSGVEGKETQNAF